MDYCSKSNFLGIAFVTVKKLNREDSENYCTVNQKYFRYLPYSF